MRLRLGEHGIPVVRLVPVVARLALIGVLIALALGRPDASADTLDAALPPLAYEWVTVDLLVLPDDYASAGEFEWVPHRPRRDGWTDDQIAEYWLDPAAIGLDVLNDRVENEMRNLLMEVP
jgi:hypothetical protein